MHLGIIFLVIAAVISVSQSNHTRTKRMYGMCPPNFYRIGSACYFMSTEKLNWLDAHFECRDKNSKLAEPVRLTDRQLRKYLLAGDKNRDEIWIGGTYEWNKHKWEWGYSGNEMKYQSFSQINPGSSQDLQYHCAVLNPELKYRWSARPCVDMHRFICQHKMPKVSARNREKVYTRWNETFPNQKANEVILEVVDGVQIPRIRERLFTYKNVTYRVSCKFRPLSHGRRRFSDDKNATMLSDSTDRRTFNDEGIRNKSSTTRHNISRPGQKRSQWTSPVNFQNNETIEKPSRHRIAFDRIAERKRQKEMKRRRRIQQKRKQKAEQQRKGKEAAKSRSNDVLNFPPPVTEILMFPTIRPEMVGTLPTQKVELKPKVEKKSYPTFDKDVQRTSEGSTFISIPIPPLDDMKFLAEKRLFDSESKTENPSEQSPVQITENNEYLKQLEERNKEEEKRIEEDTRKRNELKKSREEEMERIKKLAEEQKEEEERLAEDVKQQKEVERKIKEEEERERKEKEKIAEEAKLKAIAKQAARIEELRRVKEKIRKEKEKLRLTLAERSRENTSASENDADTPISADPTEHKITEEEKRIRLQKLRERLEKLTPEQRKKFHEMRMQRKTQKLKRSHITNKRSIIIP